MHFLLNWDLIVLRSFNLNFAHPLNDWIMSAWSGEWLWISLLGVFCIYVAWQKDRGNFLKMTWIGLTIGVSDGTAHFILKPLIGRLRPCRVEGLVRIVDGCSGWFSFPSNHASNAAVFAVLCFFLFSRRYGLLAMAATLMIGFSRIYLGVHYPSDILGGFVYGLILALGSMQIIERLPALKRYLFKKPEKT